MFYDGPERPPGIFDDFFNYLEIPITETSTSFIEFLKILPSSNFFAGPRLVIPPFPISAGKAQFCVEHTLTRSLSFSILHRFST
jgi:hypothetical protein